jgi:hypothetical protein
MSHSENCNDRHCRGCDDFDFDPGHFKLECDECGAEPTLTECGEGSSRHYLACPECDADIYLGGADDDDHDLRRAESGHCQ